LYSFPDIIQVIKPRKMIWAGYMAHMGDKRCARWVLVGRLEGKRPLVRPRRRWEDNIIMVIQEF
jgi:hypothetical protein